MMSATTEGRFLEKASQSLQDLNWLGHRVAGRWLGKTHGDELMSCLNPHTGESVFSLWGSYHALDQALEQAHHHLRGELPSVSQHMAFCAYTTKMLHHLKPLLAASLTQTLGLTQREFKKEWIDSLHALELLQKHRTLYLESMHALPKQILASYGSPSVLREQPYGVACVFASFSSPLLSFIHVFYACLATGCPLVLCIPGQMGLFGSVLAHIDTDAPWPTGFLNIVFCQKDQFKRYLNDPRSSLIAYTGSRETCDQMRKDFRPHFQKKIILHSGGKNAVLLHSSSDLKQATQDIIEGLIQQAGQKITATSRVFVYRSLISEFKTLLQEGISQLRTEPNDPEADMGPLCSKTSLEKFLRFQTMAHREATDTWHWGQPVRSHSGDGYHVTPGVHFFDSFHTNSLQTNSAYQSSVLFCPDLAVYSYDVLDDALNWMSQGDGILVSSLMGAPQFFKDRLHKMFAPHVTFNRPTTYLESRLIFSESHHYADTGLQGTGLFTHFLRQATLIE